VDILATVIVQVRTLDRYILVHAVIHHVIQLVIITPVVHRQVLPGE